MFRFLIAAFLRAPRPAFGSSPKTGLIENATCWTSPRRKRRRDCRSERL